MIPTVELAARNIPEDIERLFLEHADFVFRTAYRVTGRDEDAEDVLQGLFAGILRRQLPPPGTNMKAYLYRSAVNASLNLIRQRRRLTLVGLTPDVERRPNEDPSRGETNTAETLRLAMASLNPKAAEILILRHVHGYSDLEIAALLGTSRGAVAVNLFRSRRKLRQALEKVLGEG